MSDYDQTQHNRTYPHSTLDESRSGLGPFALLVVIAILGLFVLIGSLGGGSTPVQHPGGAGANSVAVPVDPEPTPTDGTAVVE